MIENVNRLDSNAKKILSNKTLISYFLKELIPEYKNLERKEIEELIEFSDNEIINGTNNKYQINPNNKIIYDLLITPRLPNSNEKIGMYINFEMQNTKNNVALLDRALIYAANLLLIQDSDNYENLKKVYSIWICTNPNKKMAGQIQHFTFNNLPESKDRAVYGKIEAIFINVDNKLEGKDDLLKVCNLLFNEKALEVSYVLPTLKEKFNIILGEQEVTGMWNYGEFVYNNGVEKGIEQGIEQGIQQGIKQGVQQGSIQTLASNINKLVKHGMSTKEAFDVLEISLDQQQKILEQLKENK